MSRINELVEFLNNCFDTYFRQDLQVLVLITDLQYVMNVNTITSFSYFFHRFKEIIFMSCMRALGYCDGGRAFESHTGHNIHVDAIRYVLLIN